MAVIWSGDDWDEADSIDHVVCGACGGEGAYMGTLGNLEHFRCVNCGIDFSREARIFDAWED
jgi:hypothetical protein